MSRLGGAAAVAPLVADVSAEVSSLKVKITLFFFFFFLGEDNYDLWV